MWDDFTAWFQTPGGARVLQTAIVPALAILVAGVLAALIARAALRRTIQRSERVEATSAVAALVAAARAAADQDADRGTRRRAARLRAEADVFTRLLPLPGAETAADWASARIDAVQQRAADGPVSNELDEVRDRLIDWVGHPSRAKRIFSAPALPASRTTTEEPTRSPEPAAPEAQAPAKPSAAPASAPTPAPAPAAAPAAPAPAAAAPAAPATAARPEPERFARPAATPGVRRTPPEPEARPAAESAPEAAPAPSGQPAPAVAVAAASAGDVPAWRRTRAGERLQQERGRGRTVESLADEDEVPSPVQDGTASVQLQHAHRAPVAPTPDEDEAARLEAHQQARHARPGEAPAANSAPLAPPAAAPAAGPAPAVAVPAANATPPAAPPAAAPPAPAPAWLDTYDDEAQVTQNLDLKTPPPVSASSVRDRGTPGEDLVPRS